MKISYKVLLAPLILIVGLGHAAEKQSFTVAEPLKAVDWSLIAPPEDGKPAAVSASLTEQQAARLVQRVLANSANHAFAVHAVQYQTGKLVAAQQNWYSIDFNKTPTVETLGDIHAAAAYKDARIFGRTHLGLVYLHILEAISGKTVEDDLRTGSRSVKLQSTLTPPIPKPPQSAAELIASDVANSLATIVQKDPDNPNLPDFQNKLKDLQSEIASNKAKGTSLDTLEGAAGVVWKSVTFERTVVELLKTGASGQISLKSADGAKLVPFNGYFVKSGFDQLASLAYSVDVTSKDKAPLLDLKQIIGLALEGQSGTTIELKFNLTATPFAAGGEFDTTLNSSDIAITANYSSNGKDTQIGTQTYDDEGRYWYDFSLALPIKSYNNLAYDSTSNGLTARTIKKNNLYAVFDFGLPRDTKKMKFQLVPVLMYGLPIAGQPLKHHLFAASMGLNFVNVFVGTTLDEKNFYHNFAKPLTGDNVFEAWRTHLTYGINFDVATVVKSLSKSTK